MKILGKTERTPGGYGDQYVAIVSLSEINAVFDKAYRERIEKLDPGQEIDLALGADFRDQIKGACNQMTDSMKSFEKAKDTLMKFALMVQGIPERTDGQQP